MKAHARTQKRLILLIAFSIAWIFIGSLVVFHQQHVMGKIQQWQSIAYVAPKSKEKSALTDQPGSQDDQSPDVVIDLYQDRSSVSFVKPFGCNLEFPWQTNVHRILSDFNFSLRGPPQA